MGKFRHSRQVKICCFKIELNLLLLCQVKDLRMCSLYCSFMYTNQMFSVQYMYVHELTVGCTVDNYGNKLTLQCTVHLCTRTKCAVYCTFMYMNQMCSVNCTFMYTT